MTEKAEKVKQFATIANHQVSPAHPERVIVLTTKQLFDIVQASVQAGIDMPAPVNVSAKGCAYHIMRDGGLI